MSLDGGSALSGSLLEVKGFICWLAEHWLLISAEPQSLNSTSNPQINCTLSISSRSIKVILDDLVISNVIVDHFDMVIPTSTSAVNLKFNQSFAATLIHNFIMTSTMTHCRDIRSTLVPKNSSTRLISSYSTSWRPSCNIRPSSSTSFLAVQRVLASAKPCPTVQS